MRVGASSSRPPDLGLDVDNAIDLIDPTTPSPPPSVASDDERPYNALELTQLFVAYENAKSVLRKLDDEDLEIVETLAVLIRRPDQSQVLRALISPRIRNRYYAMTQGIDKCAWKKALRNYRIHLDWPLDPGRLQLQLHDSEVDDDGDSEDEVIGDVKMEEGYGWYPQPASYSSTPEPSDDEAVLVDWSDLCPPYPPDSGFPNVPLSLFPGNPGYDDTEGAVSCHYSPSQIAHYAPLPPYAPFASQQPHPIMAQEASRTASVSNTVGLHFVKVLEHRTTPTSPVADMPAMVGDVMRSMAPTSGGMSHGNNMHTFPRTGNNAPHHLPHPTVAMLADAARNNREVGAQPNQPSSIPYQAGAPFPDNMATPVFTTPDPRECAQATRTTVLISIPDNQEAEVGVGVDASMDTSIQVHVNVSANDRRDWRNIMLG